MEISQSDTNKQLKVRYFDLGVFDGGEIVLMLDLLKNIGVTDLEVFGFEAHPGLAKKASERFSKDKRVKIINLALGQSEGHCQLHLNKNLVGSSIYKDKNNVIKGNVVQVPLSRFSSWTTCLPDDWKTGCNIIKANIEGAEWDVWSDLKSNGLIPAFNLWLGAKEGYDGWSLDLLKIKSMKSKAKDLTKQMQDANVFVYRFSSFTKRIPNSNVELAVRSALSKINKT